MFSRIYFKELDIKTFWSQLNQRRICGEVERRIPSFCFYETCSLSQSAGRGSAAEGLCGWTLTMRLEGQTRHSEHSELNNITPKGNGKQGRKSAAWCWNVTETDTKCFPDTNWKFLSFIFCLFLFFMIQWTTASNKRSRHITPAVHWIQLCRVLVVRHVLSSLWCGGRCFAVVLEAEKCLLTLHSTALTH